MRSVSSSYGAQGERQFSNESIDRLAKHDLFDFQIQQSVISVRVAELQELLLRGRDEPDLADLLDKFIHQLEDEIHGAGGNELFLLAALQHFRQQMEWCLEVDQDARMTASGVSRNIFAPTQTKAKVPPQRARVASPVRKTGSKNAIQSPRQQQKKAHSDEEAVCGVCFQADSLEHDPIVICGLCSTAVHQSCYRIEEVPEGEWYCHPCQRNINSKARASDTTPTFQLECVACRFKGGAFIATADEHWVHMACSMYLPELFVQPSQQHQGEEVIAGIEHLNNRRQLRCCFCKKKNRGACAQCCVGKCATSYHVLCALQNHTKFIFMDENDQFGSACMRHYKTFYGKEPPAFSIDGEPIPRPRGRPVGSKAAVTQQQQQQPPATKHTPMPGKKRLRRPQAASDSDSDDDDDDDGILLDEESDNSSMFSSDVESDLAATPQRKKSPVRPTAGQKPSVQIEQQRAVVVSPAVVKSPKRGRPPKRQQTLMVPSFGIVKQLTQPAPTQPTPQLVAPRPATINKPTVALDAKTQVLIPVNASALESGTFEDVVLIIPRLPLGLSLRTENRPYGSVVTIQGIILTSNPAVVDALRRRILLDGDEIVAINDVSLRNSDIRRLQEVLAGLQPPFRITLKTKTKRSLAVLGVPPQQQLQQPPAKPVVVVESPAKPPVVEEEPPKQQPTAERSPMEEALSIDWPWFYLRSDGKLAMNLMWKSLEAGFFIPKMDPATFTSLLNKVEGLLGYRLSQSHADYASTTQALLEFPSREHSVPSYIKEFRDHKKNKRRSLANDPLFLDVNVEQLSNEDEWDDRPPLAIGATIQVAKRTWPGINKLGGAGRIKKVHEETSPDGSKKKYLYDVQYVLGGGEKKVERKWIQVVGDLTNDDQKSKENTAEAEAKKKTEEENQLTKLRVGMRIHVADLEAELPPPTRSTQRRVHLTMSVLKNSLTLERTSGDQSRQMLWHQHFPVKQTGAEALLSDALAGSVEYIDDLGEDEEDEEEEEGSEVAVQLRLLQEQFQRVMTRNEALFTALQSAVQAEYAVRGHQRRKLAEIEGRHYEEMYREIAAARIEFEEENEDQEPEQVEENKRRTGRKALGGGGTDPSANDSGRTQKDASDSDSDSDVDDSCGGMFINKIKQEGNEVCVLCELTGGDFAATACQRFVHPQCAMYTPETFFKDGVAHGLDKIPVDERRALTCAICGGKKGLSKIQCANQRCLTAFHVSCAYVNGQLTRDPHYQAWCPKHLKASGMQSEIEWPPHLKPKQESGAQATGSASKRKRRRSTGGGDSKSKVVVEIEEDDDEPQEPRVTRRLVVDDSEEEVEEVDNAVGKCKAPRRV